MHIIFDILLCSHTIRTYLSKSNLNFTQKICFFIIYIFLHTNTPQSIFIRAPVTEIVVENGQAIGVRVKIGNNATPTFIPARRVVSSAGYVNTFSHLVSEQIVQQFKIPKQLSVPQSAGFVMANIGEQQICFALFVLIIFSSLNATVMIMSKSLACLYFLCCFSHYF